MVDEITPTTRTPAKRPITVRNTKQSAGTPHIGDLQLVPNQHGVEIHAVEKRPPHWAALWLLSRLCYEFFGSASSSSIWR